MLGHILCEEGLLVDIENIIINCQFSITEECVCTVVYIGTYRVLSQVYQGLHGIDSVYRRDSIEMSPICLDGHL
jgi:hypothetical protein